MSDYIEREAAISAAIDATDEWDGGPSRERWAKINAALESIPAADVRPVVRGRWKRTDAYPHRLYCSVCYKTYLKNDELLERWEFPLNYCPNCGARMEES